MTIVANWIWRSRSWSEIDVVLTLVCLVTTVLVVTGICRHLDQPPPLILIVVGIGASFLPFIPAIELSPEIVLFGLLPPLLYAAALQTSLVDFNANRRAILLLSVGLVVFTTLGIGVLVHWLVPGMLWWAAFAIGAVVAPPDAVAATAIGRRIGLPRRIVTVLEGESLLNDATALVALRTAIVASVAWQQVTLGFLVAAGGGLLVGLVVFFVVAKVRHVLTDPVLDSGLSLVTPFAAYVLAEEIHIGEQAHASGVIAVVVAGLLLGHKAPILQTAQSRITERLNWSSIAFVLEGSVFLLIGLQARRIIDDVAHGALSVGRVATVCLAALVGVVVLRMAYVFVARYLLIHPGQDMSAVPSWQYTALLGWAGMRGVVTLAAAFVIPLDAPHRELLLLIAFTVTVGTLFVQGFSLPWLARLLQVPSPDLAADALARANLLHQASQAGLAELDALEEEDEHDVSRTIRERVRRRNDTAWERINAGEAETPSEIYARRRKLMIDAERRRILDIRSGGGVPHEVVSEVLALLDVEESMLDYSQHERFRMRAASSTPGGDDVCDHLSAEQPGVLPGTPGQCVDCIREGTVWVHLRMCLRCGHVGCCDSSVGKHATAHFEGSGHPVMASAEPDEDWRWCYLDELTG